MDFKKGFGVVAVVSNVSRKPATSGWSSCGACGGSEGFHTGTSSMRKTDKEQNDSCVEGTYSHHCFFLNG